MRSSYKVMGTASVLLIACFVGSALLAFHIDQVRPPSPEQEILYLNSPKLARYISVGFSGLAADVYWIKTVQYFGDKHFRRSQRYDLLYPLLELTTSLDPHLLVAYEFGSTFLAQQPPEGAGMPEKAVLLVKQGIQQNPQAWRLYYTLGFIYYTELKNYREAAEAFQKGSEIPGAYEWMKVMAAMLSTRAGERDTAWYMWQRIYESSEDNAIRDNALRRLLALRIDQEVDDLQKLVDRYKQQTRNLPESWRAMEMSGYVRSIPQDPTGVAYDLSASGRVLVHDPDRIPFIQEGLPEGQTSKNIVVPEKAVKVTPEEVLKKEPKRK